MSLIGAINAAQRRADLSDEDLKEVLRVLMEAHRDGVSLDLKTGTHLATTLTHVKEEVRSRQGSNRAS